MTYSVDVHFSELVPRYWTTQHLSAFAHFYQFSMHEIQLIIYNRLTGQDMEHATITDLQNKGFFSIHAKRMIRVYREYLLLE